MTETRPVAFLHGWATPSWIWQSVLIRLRDHGIKTYVHDLPGYGKRVAESGEHSLAELVDDAIAHIPPNSIWVGWSLGCLIGLAAAMSSQSNLCGIFGVSATAKFCDSSTRRSSLVALEKSVRRDPEKAVKRFHRSLPSNANRREIVRQMASMCDDGSEPNSATLLCGLKILSETDLSDQLDRIKIPLRLICGREDSTISSDASHLLQTKVASCEVTALPCGHLPFLECPEIFVELLLEFIQANS